MTKYEELVAEYENELSIEERKMSCDGLYCDDVIWINNRLSSAEKLSIVAEEIGHYQTSVGNILDQKNISNFRQEKIARRWAYEKLIPLNEIKKSFKDGITTIYELAEHFDVTEDFMRDCLIYYKVLDI